MEADREPSFRDLVSGGDDVQERLFPELPEGYVERNGIELERRSPEIPGSIPYVKIRNLNDGKEELEDRPSVPAVEIGWKFSF